MALKAPKTPLQPELTPELTNASVALSAALNLEDLLADEILNGIDWQAVKVLMIEKAQQKFWQWISAAAPATPYALNEIEAIAISGEVSRDA